MPLTKIQIKSGEEMMETLTKKIELLKIKEGAIVSIIGAIDECCISNMPKNDAKKDILKTYKMPFELSGTGEIIDGKPHIHVVLGKEGNETLSGHLHSAKVQNWYVNIYILV
jgi:predicted DNA-binding protein with PD1-like motif